MSDNLQVEISQISSCRFHLIISGKRSSQKFTRKLEYCVKINARTGKARNREVPSLSSLFRTQVEYSNYDLKKCILMYIMQTCMIIKDAKCHPECHYDCAMYHMLKSKTKLFDDKYLTKILPDLIQIPTEVKDDIAQSHYELTITSTKDDPYELRTIVKKISESKMFSIIDMPFCIELTKAGIPHVHCYIKSMKPYIDRSKMKKFIPYRFSCERVKSEKGYFEYLFKEKDNPIVIDYCNKKGIPQFDNAKTPILQEETNEKNNNNPEKV